MFQNQNDFWKIMHMLLPILVIMYYIGIGKDDDCPKWLILTNRLYAYALCGFSLFTGNTLIFCFTVLFTMFFSFMRLKEAAIITVIGLVILFGISL